MNQSIYLLSIDQYLQDEMDEPMTVAELKAHLKMLSHVGPPPSTINLTKYATLLQPTFVDTFFQANWRAPKTNLAFRKLCYHFARLVFMVELYKRNLLAFREMVVENIVQEVDVVVPLLEHSIECSYVLAYFHKINTIIFASAKEAKPNLAIRLVVSKLSSNALKNIDFQHLYRTNVLTPLEVYTYFFSQFLLYVNKLPYEKKLQAFHEVMYAIEREAKPVSVANKQSLNALYAGLQKEYEALSLLTPFCQKVNFYWLKTQAQHVLALALFVLQSLYVHARYGRMFDCVTEEVMSVIDNRMTTPVLSFDMLYIMGTCVCVTGLAVLYCAPSKFKYLAAPRVFSSLEIEIENESVAVSQPRDSLLSSFSATFLSLGG